MLARKKREQIEINYVREREIALLAQSSKISDTLLRVYFLDGSFKTIAYSNNTTCCDIAVKICFSVRIALFEVERDIKNPDEFKLIAPDERLSNVLARWENANKVSAKIVLPLYDVTSTLKSQAPPMIGMSKAAVNKSPSSDRKINEFYSREESITTRGSTMEKSKRFSWFRDTISGNEAHPEIDDDRSTEREKNFKEIVVQQTKELEELRKKFETLKKIHSKHRNKPVVPKIAEKIDFGVQTEEFVSSSPSTEEDLNATLDNEEASSRKVSHGISDFGPGLSIKSHFDELVVDDKASSIGDNSENDIEVETSLESDAPGIEQSEKHENDPANKRKQSSLFAGNLMYKRRVVSSFKRRFFVLSAQGYHPQNEKNDNPPCLACYSSEYSHWPDSKLDLSRITEIKWSEGSTTVILILPNEKLILQASHVSEIQRLHDGLTSQLKLLKFYLEDTNKLVALSGDENHVEPTRESTDQQSVESNSIQGTQLYDKRNSISHILMVGGELQVKKFLDHVAITEDFFAMFNDVITKTLGTIITNPEELTHTYELISSMQTLYSFIIEMGERWTQDTKFWLLMMLKHYMKLPVERPDLLAAVIQCLISENELFAPETVSTVNDVIDVSIIFPCGSLSR
jgi:hypothetical protein